MEYIELKYISPVSKYKFPKKGINYILVISNTVNNKTYIYKIPINDINNVNKEIRAYGIYKSLITFTPPLAPLNIILYMHIKYSNKVVPLFKGVIVPDKFEVNNISHVTMRQLYKLGKHGLYSNDSVFTSEQFFNYTDNRQIDDYCMLFFIRHSHPHNAKSSFVKPTILDINDSKYIYVYDRYNHTAIKELIPKKVRKHNKPLSKIHTNHIMHYLYKYCEDKYSDEFIKEYQIDAFKINPLTNNIYEKYRPIAYYPYNNDTIISPIDSRIRGFNINPTLQLLTYNKLVSLNDLHLINLNGGSGFYCRKCPQDYNGICFPYSGDLTNITLLKKSDDHPYTMIFRIDSDYYIPQKVSERALLSVLRGNHTYGGVGVGAGSRGFPELLKKQPNTHLTYYLIIVGATKRDFIRFNNKFSNINTTLDINKPIHFKSIWVDKGEELGNVTCGGGSVIVLCNRKINFEDDIRFYSKLAENSLKKPIDCLVNMKDIVGKLD